jgi:hypothetical protein
MMRRPFHGAALGLALGLFAAFFPACPKPCGPDTCATGCCSNNVCVSAVTDGQCGTNGAMCAACSTGESCEQGVCKAPVMNTDGGTDGGPNGCMNDAECTDNRICENRMCVPRCRTDEDCQGGGKVCSAGGRCVVGVGCTSDPECQIVDDGQLTDGGSAENDPCFRSGIGCRCDLRDAPPNTNGLTGTCRRRLAPCEKCTTDQQCGVGAQFDPPEGRGQGKCALLPGSAAGADKFCLYRRVGQCACGTVDDGTGFCRPQTNSCAQVGCNSDRDCSAGAVCSVNIPNAGAGSCGGVCKPRCRWDFQNKQLASPGCPPGETCWVDATSLDPSSAFYGSGRCKPPCQSNAECGLSATNPFGGTALECRAELLLGGGSDAKRCRPGGECMDNEECPELPDNQPYFGYCDRGSVNAGGMLTGAFRCRSDCRVGQDPVTTRPYNDCRTPYACAADGGGGARVCKRLTCSEQGGAAVACSRGELCASQDRNGDGMPENPNVPTTLQNEDGCFEAPRQPGPFCKPCMNNDECAQLTAETWFTCANGAKNPSCSLLPSRCVGVAPPMGMPAGVCGIPTLNDFGFDQRAALGCPSGYEVRSIPAGDNNQDNLCSTDADCNIGTDAGRCEAEPTLRLQDGGFRKACRCTAGSGLAQCPNSDGGVRSECRNATAGSTTYCIDTVVCVPGSWAYGMPGMPNSGANYRCGLTPR